MELTDLTNPANNAGSPGGYWVGLGGFCGLKDVKPDAPVETGQTNSEVVGGMVREGRKGGVTLGTQTTFVSFSPQTCFELLPKLTNEQLEFETNYFRLLLGPKFNVKPETRKSPANISRSLSCDLSNDIPRIINNFAECEKLNNSFFMLLEKAQDVIDEMRSLNTQGTVPDQCADQVNQFMSDSEPVRFLNTSINSNINLCSEGVHFSKIGDREVEYFGSLPYQYGRVRHEPKPYPDTPFFKDVFNRIGREITNFSQDNYTCLVTRYKDGESIIPPHSDNEVCIMPGSSIYTVSIGAERTLMFENIDGTVRQYKLPDGSVYSMTLSSQLTWKHSVPRESCDDTRISFTFRRIMSTRPIPPISEPMSDKNNENQKNQI